MDNEKQLKKICGYLRMIERTRLLCNTTAELETLVGFSIGSGNSLVRKGGKSLFMKDGILRELAHIAKEETGLDLQEVLDTYTEADQICDRIGRVSDCDLVCQHLIWYYYGDEEATDDIRTIVKKAELRHIPILILLLQKVLPRLSAKEGDVDDIGEDYHRMLTLLKGTVCKNIPLQKLPLISDIEVDIRKEPESRCRLHLIFITQCILDSYGNMSTRQRISITNQELAEKAIDPEVEGIWTEDETQSVFWKYEALANGYNLFRYSLDSRNKRLCYTKYFMGFYNMEWGVMAYVLHPNAIHYAVSCKPIPNNLFAYLDCTIHEDTITFDSCSADGRWFGLKKLRRGGNIGYYTKLLANDWLEKTDNHPEDAYTFRFSIAAITNEHIYIRNDDSTFYKVPKSLDDVLEDASFKDYIGVITFTNPSKDSPTTFIAFDQFGLYYDVSTEENMKEWGISIVHTIVTDSDAITLSASTTHSF